MDYRPRLSVDLTEEQSKKLRQYLPWGLQRALFSAIIDDIISLYEIGMGDKVVQAIVTGLMKPSELLNSIKVEEP